MRGKKYWELEDWDISALERIAEGRSINEMNDGELAYEAFSQQETIARVILALINSISTK